MKRKTLIVSFIAIIISLFSISYVFAANNKGTDVKNDIRNFVGGAENVVEGAGSAVGRTVQNGMNTLGNDSKNTERGTQNSIGATTMDNGDNTRYTATRTTGGTAGITTNNTGFSTTTYTWVIIAITAVGIGVLLWSYISQRNKDNSYIDSNR